MNISTALKHRILTAVILIPLIILTIFGTSYFLYALIAAVISLAAAWEWTRLMNLSSVKERLFYIIILGFIIIISYLLHLWKKPPVYLCLFFLSLSLWWFFAFYIIYRYNSGNPFKIFNQFLYGLIGLFIIYSFWFGLVVMRNIQPNGSWGVLLFLLLIWLADASAYFYGIRYGQKKLAPKVSPGKTVEGLWGELGISFMAIFIVAVFVSPEIHQFLLLLFFGMLSVVVSIIGDLFISVLKRQRGLKDTGQLLPGHGGLLDRVDSLLAAVPVFTLGFILFQQSLGAI